MSAAPAKPAARVNVRTPEVMERVQAQVESHYRSPLVEKIKTRGGTLTVGNTTLRLAKDFGFCYGVERAIDLAYAARKVFDEKKFTCSVRSFTTPRSTASCWRWASSASRSASRKKWSPR